MITDIEIIGAFAACVVTDRAFAAGSGSIPGPHSDAGWDGWYVWRSFHYVQEAAGTVASLMQQATILEIDSKAKRKMTDDETLVLMVESETGALRISSQLRTLLMLS